MGRIMIALQGLVGALCVVVGLYQKDAYLLAFGGIAVIAAHLWSIEEVLRERV